MTINRTDCDIALAERITSLLSFEIEMVGYASLLLSGGSTPKNLFHLLSIADIDWSLVRVSMVDERFVASNHPDRNEKMLKELFLQNKASVAKTISLVQNETDFEVSVKQANVASIRIIRPITCVVLGLGADGHTASLFPNAANLKALMDLNPTYPDISGCVPPNAPHRRVTFTRKAILNSRHLLLHFYGAEKMAVLNQAKETNDMLRYPIAGFLNQQTPLEVFWAE